MPKREEPISSKTSYKTIKIGLKIRGADKMSKRGRNHLQKAERYVSMLNMENELRLKLLSTAERCTFLTGMTEQTVGLKAIKDNTVFRRIRGGANFTIKTYDRLMDFMEKSIHRKDEMA